MHTSPKHTVHELVSFTTWFTEETGALVTDNDKKRGFVNIKSQMVWSWLNLKLWPVTVPLLAVSFTPTTVPGTYLLQCF